MNMAPRWIPNHQIRIKISAGIEGAIDDKFPAPWDRFLERLKNVWGFVLSVLVLDF